MVLGTLQVILCCCRPLDDTEDDTDPDLMEEIEDEESEEHAGDN